ncbi:hypothetical protein MPTK1_2g08010 [Marchantia polymorpha subsp. ruderalis]|uniref:O-fucosyltransferase family protein n=2 Tax=Marchantia polymorpha TaxID=3197 RepID=A0A176WH96_MARPO|nr:hypothetical protein AXG93_3384s1490 [Marchantia polymorpha subsp. ruderalis]PTQ45283.1 hypothetical protein MARPO_0015s0088 [Marchantia polymorpha]BBN01514.1 hypothetical protein Mp_2g08010 [Marchantia polymorpha subsp. ruderalis]|eukprot:PTQ45283.1 hypothetical protein MARPO_0015s0088 [Marchantia polymorpha]
MSNIQRTIIGLSAVGLIVLLLNMFGNRPSALAYNRVGVDDSTILSPYESQAERGWHNPRLEAVNRKLEAKLWGKPGPVLEPCWSTGLTKQYEKTWGFVVVTCSNGPHNHRAQIADAVVVATQLGATLVLPNVKEAQKEPNSRFDDIYNVRNFISSLEGVVRVVGQLPKDYAKGNKTITSIPLKVGREYIEQHVRPVFKRDGVVYLGNFLPAMKSEKEDPELAAIRCLVMHKALEFVILIQKLGNRLLNRMREAAPKSAGNRFVAIDLQVDLLRHKTCNATIAKKKRCLEPTEVGQFLKKLGYPTETALYLTQSRWEPILDSLQQMYPNVHTKEYSMPFNEENQYLFSGKTQFEQAVDFYICSWSDVFVPTVPGVFYAHVSGERITEGLNHILVPALKNKPGSTKLQVSGAISPYVEKKSHPVYTCYCEPPSKAAAKRSQGPFALSEATVSKLSTSAGKREGRSKKSDKDVVL